MEQMALPYNQIYDDAIQTILGYIKQMNSFVLARGLNSMNEKKTTNKLHGKRFATI
jgi:hypothetical protein